MKPFFVSYRRDPWRSEILSLSRECHRRGVPTLVDISDPEHVAGQAQFDALRRIIRDECDGFILYATRGITDSACVWNVEIPTALERFDRGSYDFLPTFRDLAPSEMAKLEPHGRRISAIAGVFLGQSGAAPDDQASRIHIDVANLALARQLSRRPNPTAEPPLRIALRTRPTGVQAIGADLLVDWTPDYEEILSGAYRDEQKLGRALWDVTRAVSAVGARTIRIEGPAHLSAGLAFGFAFSRPAGFALQTSQADAIWTANGASVSTGQLQVIAQQIDPSRGDIALTVAISRPEIVADVDAAVGMLGLPVGGRIVILPDRGARRDAVVSDSHARAIVQETASALMKMRSEWGARGPIHIFMAAPFGLATLLGHSLNGFGRLLLYEPRQGGGYARTLALPFP